MFHVFGARLYYYLHSLVEAPIIFPLEKLSFSYLWFKSYRIVTICECDGSDQKRVSERVSERSIQIKIIIESVGICVCERANFFCSLLLVFSFFVFLFIDSFFFCFFAFCVFFVLLFVIFKSSELNRFTLIHTMTPTMTLMNGNALVFVIGVVVGAVRVPAVCSMYL